MAYDMKKQEEIFFDILCRLRKFRKKDDKLVVFIIESMKPRINKIAYGLRKNGYHVVLIYNSRNGVPEKEDMRYYSKLCGFDSLFNGLIAALRFKPLVYHIFTEAGSSETADFLIRNKARIGKMVFDEYDVYHGLARRRNNRLRLREKYCLENADGLCCRSLETQYLKKQFQYKYKGRRILFFDYCWNNIPLPERKRKEESEELLIVYGGRVIPPDSPDILGRTEWEVVKQLVDSLEGTNTKFILIPVFHRPLSEYQEIFDYAGSNSRLCIKDTMKFRELIHYESRCDYGIDSLECQERYDEYLEYRQETDYLSKARYYATNKYFDYLDAGIPIIYGRPGELFGRMFARFGAALPCATEKISEIAGYLRSERNRYGEHVEEARKQLSILEQIPRLIEFYHTL